jgi:hypothetical protein
MQEKQKRKGQELWLELVAERIHGQGNRDAPISLSVNNCHDHFRSF